MPTRTTTALTYNTEKAPTKTDPWITKSQTWWFPYRDEKSIRKFYDTSFKQGREKARRASWNSRKMNSCSPRTNKWLIVDLEPTIWCRDAKIYLQKSIWQIQGLSLDISALHLGIDGEPNLWCWRNNFFPICCQRWQSAKNQPGSQTTEHTMRIKDAFAHKKLSMRQDMEIWSVKTSQVGHKLSNNDQTLHKTKERPQEFFRSAHILSQYSWLAEQK